MRYIALVAVILLGCSKQDDCARFFDKAKGQLDSMAKAAGKSLGDADKAKLLDRCRKATKRDPVTDCVLAAKDDAAVNACWTKGTEDYATASKSVEAKVGLKMLGRGAKTAFEESSPHAFPVGTVPLTPATPCCGHPDQKCPLTPADWETPTWKALGFALYDPARFQFSYESDGKTFTAAAVGDPSCSGQPVTYKMTGSIDASGNPVLTEPTAP